MIVDKSERVISSTEEYFQIGNEDQVVLHSSALQYIDPNQGGSVKTFRQYLSSKNEKKESLSLERGKLVHAFMDNSAGFAIEPGKPGEGKLSEIVEEVFNQVKGDPIQSENLNMYEPLIIETARRLGFQSRWGDAAIIKNVLEQGSHYFKELCKLGDAIILSSQTYLKVSNVIESITNSPEGQYLVEMEPQSTEELFFAREHAISFIMNGHEAKALLDHLYIDFVKKIVVIRDLKTTGMPISQYMGYKEVEPDENGQPVYTTRQGAFQKWRTYRQLAFYEQAVRSTLPKRGMEFNFVFFIDACETDAPYEFRSFNINPTWINAGKQELDVICAHVDMYKNAYNLNLKV